MLAGESACPTCGTDAFVCQPLHRFAKRADFNSGNGSATTRPAARPLGTDAPVPLPAQLGSASGAERRGRPGGVGRGPGSAPPRHSPRHRPYGLSRVPTRGRLRPEPARIRPPSPRPKPRGPPYWTRSARRPAKARWTLRGRTIRAGIPRKRRRLPERRSWGG